MKIVSVLQSALVILPILVGLFIKCVKALEGIELSELGEVPATSKWALSNSNENCNDACIRKFGAGTTCNVGPMRAVNDGCILENLVEDYFSTPPDTVTCSDIRDGSGPTSPSVFGENCDFSDGSSTSCEAQLDDLQRLCCCGTEEECPLRLPTLPPANSMTLWRLSDPGEDCTTACVNQVGMGTPCNQVAMREVNTPCKMAYVAALFSANITCISSGGSAEIFPGALSDKCYADTGAESTCDDSFPGYRRFCCCSNDAATCPVS